MDSNPLDMYMLLFMYLEYLFQLVSDVGQSPPFVCFLDLIDWRIDWHLTKVVALDLDNLALCLDLALYALTKTFV